MDRVSLLRFFSLLLVLPGIIGLAANASLSTHYFDTRARAPQPELQRVVPREMNGQVLYLTELEDRQLDLLRYYGVRSFAIGLGLGLLYLGAMAVNLERWQDSEPEAE